jgi:hypothetical protein
VNRAPIDRYLDALSAALDALPRTQREDVLHEVRSHLLEAAAASRAADPESREREAVDRFGPAHEIARAMVAERMLEASTVGFRPLATARGLALAMTGGTLWTLFGLLFSLGYVALLFIGAVAIGKLWRPEAGLWLHDDGSWSLSFGGFANATEVLGPWAPLYVPVLCLVGWTLLNRLLRASLRLGRRRRAPD